MIEIRDIEGAFAAEALGLAPGRDESDAQLCEQLRNGLAHHGVLCIRLEHALDDAGFRAVAEMFGPIKDPLARTRDGRTQRYDNDRQVIDSGFVMTDEIREKLGGLRFGGLDEDRPGLFETFHCDDTYTEAPAAVTVLHALELPSGGGGNTSFLDMRAAHDDLDTTARNRLRGLRSVNAYNNEGVFPPRLPARGPNEALVDVAHPIVRTHGVTGRRSLYIDLDRATHVAGMEIEAGRGLLRQLQDHAEARAPRYDHVWCDHDILVWDNASVQHKANGDFPKGEPRRFWRHLIAGARPT
jgi:alpha-ketoglutarate-dependent taurine dioxygenase